MAKVILDWNGVITNRIEGPVILGAIGEYGLIRGLSLLAQYKLNINEKHVLKKIDDISYECASRSWFLPGAREAIKEMADMNIRMDVCSNSCVGSRSDELARVYRNKDKCLDVVDRFELLQPKRSKKEAYYDLSTGHREVFVVDDSIRNIRSAASIGLIPVFISTDERKIQEARTKYKAMCFASLKDFTMSLAAAKYK